MQDSNELIDTKGAAELLGWSARKVIRRVERKELVPVHKGDGLRGAYIFNRSDVEALLSPQSGEQVAS